MLRHSHRVRVAMREPRVDALRRAAAVTAGEGQRTPELVVPFAPSGARTALARGARGCTPLQLRLAEAAPTYGSAAFERALDAATHSKARPDNDVRLLFDGVESYEERDRLIDGAKQSIHLQTFIFKDDETGWRLARKLAEKARQGVKVRVIYDRVGSNRSRREIFDFMRAAGVEVRCHGSLLTPWRVNRVWHEKHLIVDGRVSVEGGMNIGDKYALGGSGRLLFTRDLKASSAWRDTDLRVEGAAVDDAQAAFAKNWATLGDPIPAAELAPPRHVTGSATVRVVQQRPSDDGDAATTELYLHAIRAAKKSITIETAYFVPPKELQAALIDAARRGVRVRVLANSARTSDMSAVVEAGRATYPALLAAGVEIYEKSCGGTLHAKTATFDGVYSIVGSHNLNGRSANLDSECAIAVEDARIAGDLERRFDRAGKAPVTKAELDSAPLLTRLERWALSVVSWTL